METDPFLNSKNLAEWAAHHLKARGIDEVADWRMLEYWFQVELFRLAAQNLAGDWHHIGQYEQPYYTELPRSGSKTKTKWIDLVFAKPSPSNPTSIVWVELKDIGRSETTAVTNSKGLGHDLAALWALDPAATKDLWLHPQPHSIDRGRLDEWNTYGPSIDAAKHYIAQVVIGPKAERGSLSQNDVMSNWLHSFTQKMASAAPQEPPEVAVSYTDRLCVYGLVAAHQSYS